MTNSPVDCIALHVVETTASSGAQFAPGMWPLLVQRHLYSMRGWQSIRLASMWVRSTQAVVNEHRALIRSA